MSTFIDIHVIQTLPPNNINRDDTGSPKSAVYGGVRRARVSSQAWKRAARKRFQEDLDAHGLGYRTKEAAELIARRMSERGDARDDEERAAAAGEILKTLGLKLEPKRKPKKTAGEEVQPSPFESTQYLTFFSADQIDKLAELAMSDEKVSKSQAQKAAKSDHGIALSLFGRMVADDTSLNVDASVQVAHALSTHAVDTEADYYTAVDDVNETDPAREDSGAGMIGTIEFGSSTLYRYATIMVDQLQENLGGHAEATARAARAFALGFITSMPTGKQNTFANRTVPDAVLVTVRQDQPINLVGAFEVPVPAESGYVQGSCEALARYAEDVQDAYGAAPSQAFVLRVGQRTQALADLGQPVDLEGLLTAIADAARGGEAESS